MEPVDDGDDAIAGWHGRLADVVRHGNARTHEVVVLEGPHGHVLTDPLAVILHAARQDGARLGRR